MVGTLILIALFVPRYGCYPRVVYMPCVYGVVEHCVASPKYTLVAIFLRHVYLLWLCSYTDIAEPEQLNGYVAKLVSPSKLSEESVSTYMRRM